MFNITKAVVDNLYNVIKNTFSKIVLSGGLVINPKKNKKVYDELLDILKTYTNKIGGNPQKTLQFLLNKGDQYIRFAIVDKNQFANYCYLSINLASGEPTFYVVIEMSINEVLKKDSENIDDVVDEIKKRMTFNINNIVYSLYQEVIRYKVLINFNKARADRKLLQYTSTILSSLLLRVFGKKYAPTLEDNKVKLLNLLVAYMISVYYLKFEPRNAVANTIQAFENNREYKDIINEFKTLVQEKSLTKYTDFKQLGTLLDETGILNVPGTKFIWILTTELGTKQLIDLLTSYASLISYFIIVRYPIDYMSKKLFFGNVNKELEEYLLKNYT